MEPMCEVCGRPVGVGQRVEIKGRVVACCTDPFCEEQFDDFLDNIGLKARPVSPAANGQETKTTAQSAQ